MFSILRLMKPLIRKPHRHLLPSNTFTSLQLTDSEACALDASMKKLKEKEVLIARDFFTLLFQRYPEYIDLFSLYTECGNKDLVKDELFMSQHAVGNFMAGFWEGVSMCTSQEVAADFALTVGRRHNKHCVTPTHFENGRIILLEIITVKYGNDMDATAKTGWKKSLFLLFDNLKLGVQELGK